MPTPDGEGGVLDRRPVRLDGALGWVLLRPWLDRAILAAMIGAYFPVSRVWAAAELADDDPDRLAAETPMPPAKGRARDRLRRALAAVAERRAMAAAAEDRWRGALFDASDGDGRREAERDRRAASARYMAGRSLFRPWRRRAPPVLFSPLGPEDARREFGERRADPAGLFRPAEANVEVSATVSGRGVVERWIRFDSPAGALGDTVWAHVFEPEDGYDHTVVLCHGIGMEAEVLAAISIWRPPCWSAESGSSNPRRRGTAGGARRDGTAANPSWPSVPSARCGCSPPMCARSRR